MTLTVAPRKLRGGSIQCHPLQNLIQSSKSKSIDLNLGDTLINPTDKTVLVRSGYKTVRNGWADDITIPANGTLTLLSHGDADYFSVYQIN